MATGLNNKQLLSATLSFPEFDKQDCVNHFKMVDDRHWFYDPYRHTSMLPVMSMGGKGGAAGASNFREKEPYEWLPHVPTSLVDWFEQHVFPWMGMRARISLLRTQPGQVNNVHIDCSPHSFNQRQHKFRVVLQGRSDSLYFVTKSGNVVIHNSDKPFVMDGSWPHGMTNFTQEEKYTIAVGAPWNGLDVYNNIEDAIYLDRDVHMPSDYNKYFDPSYEK
jgi:hypothetical protein